MGVIYKLRDDIVQYIVSQRQSAPLSSCRQLAESVYEKFGLRLSKSSVHDVLKESGIVTPRGRKPHNKFEIPQEKKKQIQANLSQVKLLPVPKDVVIEAKEPLPSPQPVITLPSAPIVPQPPLEAVVPAAPPVVEEEVVQKSEIPSEISPEYEGAGKVFLKAAWWDLGIFSEDIKDIDWEYYLTYAKGFRLILENGQKVSIDLPLPIERCVREVVDGLIHNIYPLIVSPVSDQGVFQSVMEAVSGFKITKIEIVGQNDHVLCEFDNIVYKERRFLSENRTFVECNKKSMDQRVQEQWSYNINNIEELLNLKGFDAINAQEMVVTLVVNESFKEKPALLEAIARLNSMYLRDEQGRLLKVQIQP